MDNYVAKPIRAEQLFEAIDSVLPDRNREAPPESALTRDVLDWSEALETAQGDPTVLKTLAEAVVQELPQLMTAIREAVAHGDPVKLRLAAHTLKGSTGYFGANRICEQAAKLEDMGRNDELTDAEAISIALETELARLIAALTEYLRGN